MNNKMSRRQFARLALGGTVLAMLKGCAFNQATTSVTPPPQTGEVGATPTPLTPARPILRNDNLPGFYVRYYKPFEAVDPAQWTLSVEGLVKNPVRLSLSDVQSLPLISQVSRMKCVECWSAAAKWEGFHLRSLLELTKPLPAAKWLHFHCADDYYESLSIDALTDERVVFVHRMNDQPLPDVYGAPLRLIIPPLYGYKNPKAIVRLVFAEEELQGYWPAVGPYSEEGTIQPGRDHPLDIGETRQIQGGEVIYPDGIESGE
jgi:DMSO/TMAO reductase YedYZ molybdopterin-dependent catalytic subunit